MAAKFQIHAKYVENIAILYTAILLNQFWQRFTKGRTLKIWPQNVWTFQSSKTNYSMRNPELSILHSCSISVIGIQARYHFQLVFRGLYLLVWRIVKNKWINVGIRFRSNILYFMQADRVSLSLKKFFIDIWHALFWIELWLPHTTLLIAAFSPDLRNISISNS